MKRVQLFCDGSCLGNPGPGGWGAIIRHEEKDTEISGGNKKTTNNEMELTAAIEALKAAPFPAKVELTTDSQYLVKGMTEWMDSWIKRGWKTSAKKPVKNKRLWEELRSLSLKRRIEWKWIRGHAGHLENERCDALAQMAALKEKQNI